MTVNVDWRAICFCAVWALCRDPSAAAACSCKPPDTPEAALRSAAAVFEGIALEVGEDAGGGQRVPLEVVRAFKGVATEEITLGVVPNSGTCRVRFTEGEGYLVFAAVTEAGLVARPCMRTQPVVQAEDDLTALGPGEVPVDTTKPVPEAILEPPSAGPKGPGGGCAGCTLHDPERRGGSAGRVLWAGVLLAWLAVRRQPRRRRRSGATGSR